MVDNLNMNALSSIEPAPPQPNQNSLMSNPLAMIGAMLQMQQLKQSQAKFAAEWAQGQNVQAATDAQGNVDTNKAQSLDAGNPAAALGAGEVANNLVVTRQNQATAANAQLGLATNKNQAANAVIGSYAQKPDVGLNDVPDIKAGLARAGLDPALAAAALSNAKSDADVKKTLATAANFTMGPGNAAAPQAAPPGPNNIPQNITTGARNYGPAAGGPMQIGPVPGAVGAQETTAGASAAQGVALGQSADSSPVRKGMLGNLETDLNNFTSGPGADWTKVAKAWANRNLPLPTGMQFDPQSIASQEAFTKQAEQLAQQQFSTIGGTGTDAKFGSAFKSNPNDTMSGLGNQGIIRLLKGNEDAIQAKNKAWQQWQTSGKGGTDSYPQFSANFNKTFDPRLYQSQYMAKSDFSKMVKTMSPAEQQQFVNNLKASQSNGYVTSPGAYYSGSQ